MSTFEVIKGDNIPETGKYYVFATSVQQDNTLIASGKNSTINCEKGLKDANADEMDKVVMTDGKTEKKQRRTFTLDMDQEKIK